MMDLDTKLPTIVLNNEGVSMLMDGHCKEAAHLLSSAKDILDASRMDQTMVIYCGTEYSRVLSIPSNTLSSSTVPGVGGCVNVFETPLLVVDENLYAHGKSQHSDPNSIASRPPSPPPMSFRIGIDFVVNYNLALSYHLLGLWVRQKVGRVSRVGHHNKKEASSTSLLLESIRCYEEAYRSLLEETDVVVACAMTILNNMGQIHCMLNDKDRATNCFQRLLATMLNALQRSRNASWHIEHWESFLENVSGLLLGAPLSGSCCQASAA